MITPEISHFIAVKLTEIIPDFSLQAAILGGILIFLSDHGPRNGRRRAA